MFQTVKVAMQLAFGVMLTACAAYAPGSDVQGPEASEQAQDQALTRPALCRPRQCGPQLGLPNTLCADGVTVAGPTGRCLRQADGTCGWEVIACSNACASSTSCAPDEYCTLEDGDCNPPPGCKSGQACIALCYGVCAPKPPRGPFCGGIAGIPCPGSGGCVDDPNDSCDPMHGGADCGGLCTCVQNVLCVRGSHFDSDPGVCACVPDDPCASVRCAAGTKCVAVEGVAKCQPQPVQCGTRTCDAGQICCSPSCGICGNKGGLCPQIACVTGL
jgi:hypothetical protein